MGKAKETFNKLKSRLSELRLIKFLYKDNGIGLILLINIIYLRMCHKPSTVYPIRVAFTYSPCTSLLQVNIFQWVSRLQLFSQVHLVFILCFGFED